MVNSIKSFTETRLKEIFVDEFFKDHLGPAEYAFADYQNTTQATRITIYANRVGLAIGKRGKNIKFLSSSLKELLSDPKLQLEVEALEDPETYAVVMAHRLASSLERGRHFRRSAYGAIRRIMASGALGCEILISGKISSQRARVESFRDGYVAKTGDIADKFVKKATAVAKIKRGILGISVSIMAGDAVIPDSVNIIAEPTHVTREIAREQIEVEDLDDELDATEDVDDFGELEELSDLDGDLSDDVGGDILEEDELEEMDE